MGGGGVRGVYWTSYCTYCRSTKLFVRYGSTFGESFGSRSGSDPEVVTYLRFKMISCSKSKFQVSDLLLLIKFQRAVIRIRIIIGSGQKFRAFCRFTAPRHCYNYSSLICPPVQSDGCVQVYYRVPWGDGQHYTRPRAGHGPGEAVRPPLQGRVQQC
jgi:hypothetical protein